MNHYSYRVTPRKLRAMLIQVIEAGLVPFVQSSPGVGKSSIMASIAEERKLKLIDHRLAASAPEDFNGLPHFVDGQARFAQFSDLFPTENMLLEDGTAGWMVFLDELNQAPRGVLAAAYKLLLDKKVGQSKLHKQVVLTAAGNLTSDRAMATNIGTALQSRLVHFELEPNTEEWIEDVAHQHHYDFRVIAFLSEYPSKLMDFNPEHENKTFCCPRTWEFVSRLIKDREVTASDAALLAGTITEGVAVEFIQFCKVIGSMVKINEILSDPENCRLPNNPSATWATVVSMMEHTTVQNFDKLAKYAARMAMDFRLVYYRGVLTRNRAIATTPAFAAVRIELSKYLSS
ncbi:AAA-ATPase [Stenotrophomonas phage C121]|uniref:ATPase n=1 Tax=Stenotrophomonas phage C121 TaxID=2914029 RepID=UPI00232977CF|nr:ATPase [Stenotrophomonas phage C121]UKL14774.1 AAA-ATPase [Stenotrophomonas phage C121]